jgi:hypothetical protein
MASVAPHVNSLIAAELNVFQVLVDIVEHAEHFASAVLVRIVVGGEIVRAQWFAFLSFMAIRATNT